MMRGPCYVSFQAEVVPPTCEALLGAIGDLVNKGATEISLMLSTPGGNVQSGIAAYNTLRSLPIKLVTHNIGQVNSIGNVIFLAGQERFASVVSSFMFHGVGVSFSAKAQLEEKALTERLGGLKKRPGPNRPGHCGTD